jgi:hypothetical protein
MNMIRVLRRASYLEALRVAHRTGRLDELIPPPRVVPPVLLSALFPQLFETLSQGSDQ